MKLVYSVKYLITIGILGFSNALLAQIRDYKPFSEAEKAITATEKSSILYDSLRRVYKNRWTVGLLYGQRFIENANVAVTPDTITFADFTEKKAFFGIEGGYFIKQNLQVFLSANILILPREQNINSISFGSNGLQIEGSGNGGLMINIGMVAKYFLKKNSISRPYVGLKLGNIRTVAKGGSVSSSRIGDLEIEELIRNYRYAELSVGFNHRIAPRSIFDINLSYLKANKSDGIGGIVSPGGLSATLGFYIVINARKDD